MGVLAASWKLFPVTACRIKFLQTLLPPKWPPLTKCPSTHWARPVQRGALQCLWAGSAGCEEGRLRWIPQNGKCFSSCSSNSEQAYSLGCWTQDFVLSFFWKGIWTLTSLLKLLCSLIWNIGITASTWSKAPFAQFHWTTLTVPPAVNSPPFLRLPLLTTLMLF